MDLTINYNEQMLDYYPEIIKSIREFQVMINTQSLQVEEMHAELTRLLSNNYINDADEVTISRWEKLLGIRPLDQGEDDLAVWLEDRRETILARLYSVEKLNSQSISKIVEIFTGGTATSHFKDGVIHVSIKPPPGNKQFKFDNVEQELRKKMPAHLMFRVSRDYYTWLKAKGDCETWDDVKSNFTTWEDLLNFTDN